MRHSANLHIVPPIIAHRGANHLAPENTLAAFLKASELGFTWVEFDVMLSKDAEVVVIHDEELSRTTNGVGAVIDYPLSYLETLDAGSWFDSRFSYSRISTLQTVLSFLYQHKLSANIEIKGLQGCNELVVEKVFAILNKHTQHFMSPPLISSFSLPVLQLARQKSADIMLGFLMDEWMLDWETQCDQLQCVAVNMNHQILNRERAEAIKVTGRQLLAYTVNDLSRAQQLYSWGVDAVFSDCLLPEQLSKKSKV